MASMFRLQRAALLVDSAVTSHHHTARGLRTSARFFRAAEKAEETIAGIPYKNLSIGVPKEIFTGERRVAIAPANVALLTKKGFTVNVEDNAGLLAKFTNEEYAQNGANIKGMTSLTIY